MSTSFYSRSELAELGLKAYGENVLISRKASLYGAHQIELGNHVRIDDFCLLSGKIKIDNYIHVGAYSAFFGGQSGITLEEFAGVSMRVTVLAETDNFDGHWLVGPMNEDKHRNLICGPVNLGRYTSVGAGSVILPGVQLAEGCAVGSQSLVKHSTQPWGIYCGTPAKFLKPRSRKLLAFVEQVKASEHA